MLVIVLKINVGLEHREGRWVNGDKFVGRNLSFKKNDHNLGTFFQISPTKNYGKPLKSMLIAFVLGSFSVAYNRT